MDDAAHVSLFQRTAQWVMADVNPPVPEEKKAQYRADPASLEDRFHRLADVFNSTFCAAVAGENPEAYATIAQACEDNLNTNVHDPALREKLRPNYKVGCKRLVVSGVFYPALQQDNAELVTEGIARIEPEGVRTVDGRLHALDVLVLATGFNPHRFFRPMAVTGRGGLSLDQAWSDANIAYRGVSVPDFPNWFMLGGPNSPIGNFSFLRTVEHQLNYVLQLVALLRDGQACEIAARPESTAVYNDALKAKMAGSIWASGCNSWYIDKNGAVASYPWSYETFERDMSAPVLEDYELLSAAAPARRHPALLRPASAGLGAQRATAGFPARMVRNAHASILRQRPDLRARFSSVRALVGRIDPGRSVRGVQSPQQTTRGLRRASRRLGSAAGSSLVSAGPGPVPAPVGPQLDFGPDLQGFVLPSRDQQTSASLLARAGISQTGGMKQVLK